MPPKTPQTPNYPIQNNIPGAPKRKFSEINAENVNLQLEGRNLDVDFVRAVRQRGIPSTLILRTPLQERRVNAVCTPASEEYRQARAAQNQHGALNIFGGGLALFAPVANQIPGNLDNAFANATGNSTPNYTDPETLSLDSSGVNTPTDGFSYIGINPSDLFNALAAVTEGPGTPVVDNTENDSPKL